MMFERAVLVPLVVPQRRPLHRGGIDLFGAFQHEHVAEALPTETPEGPAKLRLLLRTTWGPKARSSRRRFLSWTDPLGEVQHDGDGEAVVLPGEVDERLAGLGLDVRGVDDRQPPQGEPLGGDEVQDLEGVVRRRLIVLLVADYRTAGVRRQNLVGRKCRRANVLLPDPLGPIRTTSDSFGDG